MSDSQYTLRGVPRRVDKTLRAVAAKEKKSLNQAAIEAIERGLGLGDAPVLHHDLDQFCGTWKEDPEFDRAIKAFDAIDEELWK